MSTNLLMSSEVTFESEPAKPDTHIEPGTYAQALYGLLHDRGVAENVFASRAKSDFAEHIRDLPKRLQVRGPDNVWPMWVDQQTYAIDIKDLPTSPKDEMFLSAAKPLEQMVRRIAVNVIETHDKGRLILIGALNVRVQDLGGGKFSFALKQKWAFDE